MANELAFSRFVEGHSAGKESLRRTRESLQRMRDDELRRQQEAEDRRKADAMFRLSQLSASEQKPDYALKLLDDNLSNQHEKAKAEQAGILGIEAMPTTDYYGDALKADLAKIRDAGVNGDRHAEDMDWIIAELLDSYSPYLSKHLSSNIAESIDNPQQEVNSSVPGKPQEQGAAQPQTHNPRVGEFGVRDYLRTQLTPYLKPRAANLTDLMKEYTSIASKAPGDPILIKTRQRILDIARSQGLAWPTADDLDAIALVSEPIASPTEQNASAKPYFDAIKEGIEPETAALIAEEAGVAKPLVDLIRAMPKIEEDTEDTAISQSEFSIMQNRLLDQIEQTAKRTKSYTESLAATRSLRQQLFDLRVKAGVAQQGELPKGYEAIDPAIWQKPVASSGGSSGGGSRSSGGGTAKSAKVGKPDKFGRGLMAVAAELSSDERKAGRHWGFSTLAILHEPANVADFMRHRGYFAYDDKGRQTGLTADGKARVKEINDRQKKIHGSSKSKPKAEKKDNKLPKQPTEVKLDNFFKRRGG